MGRGLKALPWFALAILCGLAYFWRLGANGIFDLDEGLYAEAAREMALTGDLVTPRVNGHPFFEKPPLIYWEAAASFHAFGRSEFTARLPSALATALLVGLIYGWGSALVGRRAAFLAAVLFALSPLVFGEARQLTTDATLGFLVAAGLTSFYAAHTSSDPRGRRWYYAFWAACGLAVLAKGSAGILPLIIAFVFVALEGRFRLRPLVRAIWHWRIAGGLLLFLGIALPWHVAAYRAGGSAFVQEWIVRQNLGRFRGGDTAHHAPIWFYVPGFLLGAFPWSFFLVPAVLGTRAFRRRGEPGSRGSEERPKEPTEEAGHTGLVCTSGPTRRAASAVESDSRPAIRRVREAAAESPDGPTISFLLTWVLVVFGVFSLSGSKLVSYILPMYAPAALLTASWLVRALDEVRARRALVAWGVAAFALSATAAVVAVLHEPILRAVAQSSHRPVVVPPEQMALFPFAEHLLGAAALGALLWVVLTAAGKVQAAVAAMLIGMTAVIGVAVIEGLPVVDRAFSSPLHQAAREAGALAAHRMPLAVDVGKPSRPSAFFYFPDSLMPQRPAAPSDVMDLSGDDAAADRFAAGPVPRLILASAQRAARLTAADPSRTRLRVIDRRGGWEIILKSGPSGSERLDWKKAGGQMEHADQY